ncbi:helix-turn-helix domain-containing protein [Methylovirgula sp. 4M-Z18]|uniref:helix-turn-helix domain-containing protein n=1 Tax=Methylovirgula sp. 4M-Z18 TaxID=2293567 RepID=UPI000E2F492C|nr:helix-turn-helix domain-containing protein [Methylovirgula sp. 4M-Z18]
MGWGPMSTGDLRAEFVSLAGREGSNVRALCRRFGISTKTGYKWLARFREEGASGLSARSRRSHKMPRNFPRISMPTSRLETNYGSRDKISSKSPSSGPRSGAASFCGCRNGQAAHVFMPATTVGHVKQRVRDRPHPPGCSRLNPVLWSHEMVKDFSGLPDGRRLPSRPAESASSLASSRPARTLTLGNISGLAGTHTLHLLR